MLDAGVRSALQSQIDTNVLSADKGQMAVADALDACLGALTTVSSRGLLSRLIRQSVPVTQGLYVHGGVGRGKTMLMDMFHQQLLSGGQANRTFRLHFHDFMVMAQDLIHSAREGDKADPIEAAADALAARGNVMCFDEMEVRDIADAMILARLFTALFARHVTVVATSNRHPDDLYKDGLHRDRFLPFITLLKSRCRVLAISNGQDWRASMLANLPAWYVPDDAEATAALDDAFARLTSSGAVTSEVIRVAGRDIRFDAVSGDVARVSFEALCETPLAARDYLAIASRFAGLVIDHVPVFDDGAEPAARRFMWLIDALYDRQRFLIVSSAAAIEDLYDGHHFKFEFDRTCSRLGEMTRRMA